MRETRGPKMTAMIFIKMKQNNKERGGEERGGEGSSISHPKIYFFFVSFKR